MKKNFRRFFLWIIIPVDILFTLFLMIAVQIYWTSPDVRSLKNCLVTSMYQVQLCPKGPNYRTLAQIAPSLQETVVLSEDAAFYSHQGFDWFEIKESITTNWQRGKFSRGGSTITQQLVKNVFLGPEKSLLRKLKEAYLTYQVEKYFTKKEILERYLNVVELGPGIYGVQAAAKYYFQKNAANLNLLESAYLAFLLPNPIVHHQYYQKRALTSYARKRLEGIVHRPYLFGKITASDYHFARSKLDAFPWRDLVWMPVAVGNEGPEDLEMLKENEPVEWEQEVDQELEQLPDLPTPIPDYPPLDLNQNGSGTGEGDELPSEYL